MKVKLVKESLNENNSKVFMKFTLEELEIIKDALIVSLEHSDELNDGDEPVIKILDRIDEETELD